MTHNAHRQSENKDFFQNKSRQCRWVVPKYCFCQRELNARLNVLLA
nr:MAG TPA: RNA polymerase sigma factor [Caudoviricetes sp.]